MRSGEGVIEYFSRVMIVANKMRIYGDDMQDVKVRRHGEEQGLKVTFEGGRGRGRGTYRGRGRGEVEQTSIRQLWSDADAINLDIFGMNVPPGTKKQIMCSNHMYGDRTMFNELDENFRHSVKLGNNTKMDVMGKGSVKLLLDGVNHVVEVYYIIELSNTLLKHKVIARKRLGYFDQGEMCKIFHLEKCLIIQTNMSANRMFIFRLNSKLVSHLASEVWAFELQGFENLAIQEHAVNWTIYVLNRCPTLAIKNVTPEEAWSGVKPSVDHFRVFVSEESKGYRLFDPIAKRVVVSKDVIFEEEKQWDWDSEELRQSCDRQPPTWMGDYVSGEGLFEDDVHMALNANWRLAMNNEIKSIEKNQTWTLIELPAGAKKIGVKWVYKTKYNEHGNIDKYKACLVAKGILEVWSGLHTSGKDGYNKDDYCSSHT
ncbi:hypothetical protein AAG906_029789 [Vitis piasezkii]